MSPVKYELSSYMPEDGMLHKYRETDFFSYEQNYLTENEETEKRWKRTYIPAIMCDLL
jgi:hypothetical protein